MSKAILKQNVAVQLSNGRVGNIRYVTKDGNTYTRTTSCAAYNPRTDRQMRTRTRVCNITNNYRMMKDFLLKCFERSNKCVTRYNFFFQLAAKATPVYLTRELARSGAAVAAPYAVSEGSLPPIQYALNTNGILESNLNIGSLSIGEDTTVGELAKALVDGSEGRIQYGDFITFIEVIQKGSAAFPTIAVKCDNVKLIENSTEVLAEKVATHGFASEGGHLAMDGEPDAGCYGWIHSRDNGSVAVSSQYLYNCNQEMLAQFGSDEAFETARNSYGISEAKAFVVSDDGEGGEEPVPPVEGKTVSVSVPSAMQAMGDIQINDRTKGKTDTLVVPTGSAVTLKAIPASGDYQFLSWSDGNTQATRSLTVSEDISLTASFSPVE